MERYIENKLIKAAMNTGPNPMYRGGRTQPPGVVFHLKHTMKNAKYKESPNTKRRIKRKGNPRNQNSHHAQKVWPISKLEHRHQARWEAGKGLH